MRRATVDFAVLAAGGALGVLALRRRRTPPREVQAALGAVDRAYRRCRDALPEPEDVAVQLGAVRAELTAARPHPVLLPAYLEELAYEVTAVDELAGAVADLRARIDARSG